MEIKQLEDNEEDKKGFKLVYLKSYKDIRATPHCKNHGAMNKFPTRNIWRCLSEYGYELKEGNTKPTFNDRTCPACCIENSQ